MKVSLNWAQQYSNVDLKSLPVEELVKLATERLGGIEGYADLGKHYEGIVIARVASCVKHPNADKLSLCKIDDAGIVPNVERDDGGNVQVICGAPNVREGLLVAWLPPGTTVPATVNDLEPLVLDRREIRGLVSNGMLASVKELDLGDDHGGILELDNNANVGEPLAKALELDDVIVDIENKMFTHRPDCFGQLGVARELAGIQHKSFQSPDWYKSSNISTVDATNELQVSVEADDLCPRYMAVVIDDIDIKPSPLWLQTYLKRVGIRSINNVVDVTNYIMALTAQPLHAFDFDKVAKDGKAEIIVRRPHEGEEMTLLDGKKITPHKNATLICNPDGPIALGGVMGGGNSEIDENTKRIVLECATFDMYNIRKTSMIHGIFTDAVTRFNKGQPAEQLPFVMGKTIEMFKEIAGAKTASEVVDNYKNPIKNQPVQTTVQFINDRLGKGFTADEIKQILENVEISVQTEGENLVIQPPFWRTDLEIAEDIVEEVGRLYGFNNLPVTLPQRSIEPIIPEAKATLQQNIREFLSQNGANEVTNHSFVSEKLIVATNQDVEEAYKIRNALSPELNYYRITLLPSLLDKIHANHRANYDVFGLFELGKVHNKTEQDDENLPLEREVLSFAFSADKKSVQNYGGAPFYQAKNYLVTLAGSLGIKLDFASLEKSDLSGNVWLDNLSRLFIPHRSAAILLGGKVLGVIGEFDPQIRTSLKLPGFSAGFELSLQGLESLLKHNTYKPLSRYPATEQDVTYEVAIDLELAAITHAITQTSIEEGIKLVVDAIDAYSSDDTSKRLTWRLSIRHQGRTLIASDIQDVLKSVDDTLAEQFSATRV